MHRRLLNSLLTVSILSFTNPILAETVFPQIALGGGYEVILLISNNSTEIDWEAEIQLLQGAGQPWRGTWMVDGEELADDQNFVISIPPLGTSRIEITDDGQLQVGYLTIQKRSSFEGEATISLFYNYKQKGRLVDSTATAPSVPDYQFLVPVEKQSGINTGFAWAPHLSIDGFHVNIGLLDSGGNQISEISQAFEGHLARFFDEIFTGVPDGFVGSLRFDAERHFHLTALRMDSSGFTPLTGQ